MSDPERVPAFDDDASPHTGVVYKSDFETDPPGPWVDVHGDQRAHED